MNIESEILEIKSILRTVAHDYMESQRKIKNKNRWNRGAFDPRKHANEKRQLLILELDELIDYLDGLCDMCEDKRVEDKEVSDSFAEVTQEIENRTASIYEAFAELKEFVSQ